MNNYSYVIQRSIVREQLFIRHTTFQEKDNWNEMNENTELYMEKAFLKTYQNSQLLSTLVKDGKIKQIYGVTTGHARAAPEGNAIFGHNP